MKCIDAELSHLVALFGGEVRAFLQHADVSLNPVLQGFQSLDKGFASHLGFLSSVKYREQLLETQLGVVLVRADAFADLQQYVVAQRTLEGPFPLAWLVSDPYLYYAKVQQWWVDHSEFKPAAGIHSSAVVDSQAHVDASASVGPNVVIGAGSVVGARVRLEAGVVLGRDTRVGNGSRLYPNVTIYDECVIGDECILHSGCVIGADGFGFANEQGRWVKIPQIGRVVLANHVEVGANTTIDRGALDDTLIGFGVKLDNQIMVAHNVHIGEHTAMAGCVGIAGSTHIGARCTIGGAAMILGHLDIPDGTHISAATTVMSSIKQAGAYTGIFPLEEHKAWEKTAVSLRQLVKLRTELRELQKNN
jgi:UDP-3-O-[3-hydroxymyristoyl] glucosamine N-acyltransferase